MIMYFAFALHVVCLMLPESICNDISGLTVMGNLCRQTLLNVMFLTVISVFIIYAT